MGQTDATGTPVTAPRPVLQIRKSQPVPAKPVSKKPAKSVLQAEANTGVTIEAPKEQKAFRRVGKRSRNLIGGAVVLTLIVAGYIFHTATSQDAAASASEKVLLPHARSIAAPGLVESESGQRNLSCEIPGILKAVYVQEGQKVKTGDLVAELENAEASARMDSAGADLAVAESNFLVMNANLSAEILRAECEVDRLKAELALMEAGPRNEEIVRAQAEQRVANAEAQRVAEDAARFSDQAGIKSGAWSEADRSRLQWTSAAAKARLDVAKANQSLLESGSRQEEKDRARAALAIAEAELKQFESTQPFKLAAAHGQIKQAQAKLKQTEAELAKTRLHSPINGVVVWKFLHAGEAVDPTHPSPVVAIADLTRLRVRADVDEADYPQIAKGQSVRVSADAFKGKVFTGKVQRVADSAGQKRFSTGEAKERMDVKVVETVITLEENCPFKLGLRCTVYFDLDAPAASPKNSN